MSFTTPKPHIEQVESRPGCIHAALCVLGDKWSPLMIGQLVEESLTFSDLEKRLRGISPRTLSARLEKLQTEGIVVRHQYNEHPPRYTYSLSSKGKDLVSILHSMASWGEKYQ